MIMAFGCPPSTLAVEFLYIETRACSSPQVKPLLAKILKMSFLTDTDFLASSLWPNNPSLHPPILYGLFKDWDGKSPYDPAKVFIYIYR